MSDVPALPEHYTVLDRHLLEQIREVWQAVKLPKPHDWARDHRGVRIMRTKSGFYVPEDGQGPQWTHNRASQRGYVLGKDDRQRAKANEGKAVTLSYKMCRLMCCEWWEAMEHGRDFYLRTVGAASRRDCEIVFLEDIERYVLPNNVFFTWLNSDVNRYYCRIITDECAVRYVTAGRDNPDDYGPDSKVYKPAGVAGDGSTGKRSARAVKSARQDDLF